MEKEDTSKLTPKDFVNLIFKENGNTTDKQIINSFKCIYMFSDNEGLFQIYEEIKELVHDAEGEGDEDLKKNLEIYYQALCGIRHRKMPFLLKYIKDIKSNDKKINDDLIKSANEEIKKEIDKEGNIDKDIIESFAYKLIFLYLFVYDNIVNPQKIDEINKKVEDHKEKFDLKLDSVNVKINSNEQQIENKIKSNVYSEFITILGIFTAITFAIFGGMNLLSNLFNNIDSTPASLGRTLILAAVFGLIMWGIIELLFHWISKIKEPLNQSENAKKDTNKKERRSYPAFIKKNAFNLIALGVLAGILILGVLLFIH